MFWHMKLYTYLLLFVAASLGSGSWVEGIKGLKICVATAETQFRLGTAWSSDRKPQRFWVLVLIA